MRWVRSIRRAMAPVRFSWGAFLVLLVFIGLADGIAEFLYWLTGFLESSLTIFMQKIATFCFALFYGYHRGWNFHPARDPKYMEWLRDSPWTPDKALPMGPVRLVWQDLAVLGILMALAMRPFPCAVEDEFTWASYPTFTVLAFLAGYLPCLLVHGLRGGNFSLLWKVAPFVAGETLAFPHWPLMTLLALAAYPFLWANVQRGLSRAAAAIPPTISIEIKSIGWNFMKLSTHGVPRNIPKRVAATVALMAGLTAPLTHLLLIRHYGTTQAGQALLKLTAPHYLGIGFAILIVTLFLLRIQLYSASASPFRICHRLFNRRWIVPVHDRIYVAPLAILGIGTACVWLALRTNIPDWIVYGIGSAVAMYACLGAGPGRRSWYLTGPRHVAEAVGRFRKRVGRNGTFRIGGSATSREGSQSIIRWALPIPGLSLFNRWILSWACLLVFVALALSILMAIPFRWTLGGIMASYCAIAHIFAMLFLVTRSSMFHPAAWPEYRAWLELTPWTPKDPLPLGPITPRWQDILVFLTPPALYWALGPHTPLQENLPPETVLRIGMIGTWSLLLAYAAGACVVFLRTGRKGLFLVEGFAVGSLLIVWPNPVLSTVISAAMAGLGAWGVGRSLRGFPWAELRRRRERHAMAYPQLTRPRGTAPSRPENVGLSQLVAYLGGVVEPAPPSRTGPGLARLSPKVRPELIGKWGRAALAGLAGWMVFSMICRALNADGGMSATRPPMIVAVLISLVVAILGSVARLVFYFDGIAPPISFLGRLGTGRLIVPRFDRVFVTPLCAVALSILLPVAGRELGIPDRVWMPVSISTTLLVLFLGGPSLANWRLTGAYRVHLKPQPTAGEIDLLALFKRPVSPEEESKKPGREGRFGP